jgi:SAM-dependent methyltransferase
MIDRTLFPDAGDMVIRFDDSELVKPLRVITDEAVEVNRRNALTWDCLRPAIADMVEQGRRPKLLDLGGRRRSGGGYTDALTMCDITVFDILPDPGVDVVGDAHALGDHFPAGHFDFVMCNSVFEHLLMPWKVALELGRVLRLGGLCYIHTHQTIGLHDMPWDFWRYSDTAWNGLFNRRTGFEIVTAQMSYFTHIVTAAWTDGYAGTEASGGFEASGVLVRKIGASDLRWDVTLGETIATAYPA